MWSVESSSKGHRYSVGFMFVYLYRSNYKILSQLLSWDEAILSFFYLTFKYGQLAESANTCRKASRMSAPFDRCDQLSLHVRWHCSQYIKEKVRAQLGAIQLLHWAALLCSSPTVLLLKIKIRRRWCTVTFKLTLCLTCTREGKQGT